MFISPFGNYKERLPFLCIAWECPITLNMFWFYKCNRFKRLTLPITCLDALVSKIQMLSFDSSTSATNVTLKMLVASRCGLNPYIPIPHLL
jgi:hypothetical protein